MDQVSELFNRVQTGVQPYTGLGTAATAVASGALALYKWGGRALHWRWPGSEIWGSDAVMLPRIDDSRQAWQGGVHDRWTTYQPQAAGMWYRLDLGRVVQVDRIVFDHARSFKDYPSVFQLDVSVDGEQLTTTRHDGPIDVTLKKTTPVRYVRVTIVEPQKDTSMYNAVHWWSIHDIRIYERRAPFWVASI